MYNLCVSDTESENGAGAPTETLLQILTEELGFKETPDLKKYREALKSAENFGDFVAGLREYQKSGGVIVDHLDNSARPKGQIALILASANIYYSKGMFLNSREALEDALLYAVNIGYIEAEDKIRDILSGDPKYKDPGPQSEY